MDKKLTFFIIAFAFLWLIVILMSAYYMRGFT